MHNITVDIISTMSSSLLISISSHERSNRHESCHKINVQLLTRFDLNKDITPPTNNTASYDTQTSFIAQNAYIQATGYLLIMNIIMKYNEYNEI